MGFTTFEISEITTDLEILNDTTNDVPAKFFGDAQHRCILMSMIVTTDDPVDVVLGVWATYAGTGQTLLATITVPGQSGFFGGGPAVDLVPLVFPIALSYLAGPDYGLAIALINSLSAGKFVWITTMGGSF